jgi:hypothetical protein
MSTVESVFRILINFLGLRKVNTLGQAGAQKCMLMAATAFNLKKLLKYAKKPIKIIARSAEIQPIISETKQNVLLVLFDFMTSHLRPSNPILQNDL